MNIAIAQINTTVGDFDGNAEKILNSVGKAELAGANVVVLPELCVCGYFPRDLLEKSSFIRKNLDYVEKIAARVGKTAVVIGYVSPNEDLVGRSLFNSVALLHEGKVKLVQHKSLLPEYDVFDEGRYFEPAIGHTVVEIFGKKVGLTACEDMWFRYEQSGRRFYRHDPMTELKKQGVEIVLSVSASPFTIGKQEIRYKLIRDAAREHRVPIVYSNLVGGNDELVFDGRSFAMNADGDLLCEARAFEEDMVFVDAFGGRPMSVPPEIGVEDEVRRALVLGLRDYMAKCGFKSAVIGLSGGIDSAVVAAIACEAIGAENVHGVMMPSQYSSKSSITDSEALARNLGMKTSTCPIGKIYDSYRAELEISAEDEQVSLVEENIQARIRGNILMALSNKEGALVLSTGNKSELSVGYCTLYGDMAGGFALISDLPKTMVYSLARHLNRSRELIPPSIITKAPSAELKPDQRDADSLPPYEVLDPIISAYIEDRRGVDSIVELGFDKELVKKIVGMIDRNEYKRRQAAPGVKITSKAFGTGRRLPIARKY